MSRLRWVLVALLVLSTALFAVGAIAERPSSEGHAAAASAETSGSESAHQDGEVAGAHETREGAVGAPSNAAKTNEGEALLGVDLESTPLIMLAVIAGLALAALATSALGRLPRFLLVVAVVAALWAALDVREVVHQLNESRAGIAVIATAVAALHIAAAAIGGRLAAAARQAERASPGRAGTMPA